MFKQTYSLLYVHNKQTLATGIRKVINTVMYLVRARLFSCRSNVSKHKGGKSKTNQ